MRARLPVGLLLAVLTAGVASANGDWKTDVVHLKTGKSIAGLTVKDTPDEITFQVIRRSPGRPVVTFQTTIPRAEIKRLDKLAGKERDELLARINALLPGGSKDDSRLQGLDLKPAFLHVVGFERKKALSYFSDHFELTSNASEEIVRRAALRLEQMYAAYAHFLPPVNRPARPNTTTTIILFQSVAEYQATLKGRSIFNPAFYDSASNEIYGAAELQQLGSKIEQMQRSQVDERNRLVRQEMEILKLPRGEVQDRARQQIVEARQELADAAARNEESIRLAMRPLMHCLYHEAFHAYLANFVFPPDKGEVPRWLNEGLAQIFETAIVEGNDLKIGHADPGRLELAQAALAKSELIPLTELLKSNLAPFVLAHGQNRQVADRYYLTSWALAHYLMMGRRVLGTPAFEAYLTALNGKVDPRSGVRERSADPLEAMQKLTGQPVPQLEKALQEYILKLK